VALSIRAMVPITRRALIIGISIVVIGLSLSQMLLSFTHIPGRPGDVRASYFLAGTRGKRRAARRRQ